SPGRNQALGESCRAPGPRPTDVGSIVAPRSRRRKCGRELALARFAQYLRLGQLLELLQGVVLDLADPLAGHPEGVPHLFQGQRLRAGEPVAQLDHLALTLGQHVERLANTLALKV